MLVARAEIAHRSTSTRNLRLEGIRQSPLSAHPVCHSAPCVSRLAQCCLGQHGGRVWSARALPRRFPQRLWSAEPASRQSEAQAHSRVLGDERVAPPIGGPLMTGSSWRGRTFVEHTSVKPPSHPKTGRLAHRRGVHYPALTQVGPVAA